MEADWEVEIGGDAPVIDALWAGFADLRAKPALAHELPEAAGLPALAKALERLNSAESPVWTAKCDVWPVLDASQVDPYEMGASQQDIGYAWACYIDLLPRSDLQGTTPAMVADFCKTVCGRLASIPLSACRVDMVVRSAVIALDLLNMGITAYVTACGRTSDAAKQRLADALQGFTGALKAAPTVE